MSAYKCWCGRSLSSSAQCVVHGSGYESPQDGTVKALRTQLAATTLPDLLAVVVAAKAYFSDHNEANARALYAALAQWEKQNG